MDFEKKNNIYKIVMLIIVTAAITFIITAIGISNFYENTQIGVDKVFINNENISSNLNTKIQSVRKYIDSKYYGEFPEEEKLLDYAIKGYVSGLGDEYTEYLTKDEYSELKTNIEGNYIGIGVYMSQDRNGNIIVLKPIEDSPAEKAGLKTGDIITKVDNEECTGMDLSLVASKIKGEEGTKVNLEIQRDGEKINVEIDRKTIQIYQVKSKVLENDIGYIQILSFDENSSKDFEEKLNELLQKNVKSLIVDVRDNGGGIVSEATAIAELFMPKDKTIVKEFGKNEKETIIKTEADAIVNNNIKVIILSNENSASASELLIGALKDNEVATIIGTTSFGKGVMQEIVPMKDGGALKVTIEEFRTPNGNVINKKGIEPNIVVEDNKETDEDEQLQKAIEECKKGE